MKLWNPTSDSDRLIERYTVGRDYELDQVLVPYDCRASIAHAEMLEEVGVLTQDEVDALISELQHIISLSERDEFTIAPEQEDCHTAIEEHLTEQLGDTGKKIHTGRSRNDQIMAALRLYYRDALDELRELIDEFTDRISDFIEKYGEIRMAGYTHTRKAMPSSMGLWAGVFHESMLDNLGLMEGVRQLLDQSPLGSGAGYGIPMDIDREYTADKLEFSRIQKNPLYVQHSRGKFEAEILHFCTQVMYDLNRAATDLIFFSMRQIGYIELPEKYCTGSSIMPQKKNPDVLELVRGNYHTLCSLESRVHSITGNLISGYHRDLQLTKEPVMEGIQITMDSLAVTARVFEEVEVNEDRCGESMTDELFATERVYQLVEQGVPFREAYRRIAGEYRQGNE